MDPTLPAWSQSQLPVGSGTLNHQHLSTFTASESAEPVPHFFYIEKFEDGLEYSGISCGGGKFVDTTDAHQSPHVSFTVEKDRAEKTISVDIRSLSLSTTISRALVSYSATSNQVSIDFDTLMKDYDSLKSYLMQLETHEASLFTTREFRLLVRDFLLDRSVFAGIGMEHFRQRNILCQTHVNDIHQRSVDAGLDEIGDCFALGLIPDSITDDYINALNEKYSELALSGDYLGLYNLCEPLVRSGDIELQHNPALLVELLDQGRFDIYWYLQDVVSRTRAGPERIGSFLTDIAQNPLFMAIRNGDGRTAQSLLQEGQTFEGYALDEATMGEPAHVFTPLSAAVFWGRHDIARLILKQGPPDAVEVETAVVIALSRDDVDVIKVLLESGVLPLPPDRLINGRNEDDPPDSRGDTWTGLVVEEATDHDGVENCGLSAAQIHDDTQLGHFEDLAPAQQSNNLDGLLAIPLYDPFDHDPLPKCPGRASSKRREVHTDRQKLGRRIVHALSRLCKTVREACRKAEADRPGLKPSLFFHYTSFTKVWNRGLAVFRQIINNQPPHGLVDVLDCLVVAGAICAVLSTNNEWMHHQFLKDLDRWRDLLEPSDQRRFDDVAFSLWAYTYNPEPVVRNDDPADVQRFQKLIENLVSTDEEDCHNFPQPSAPFASRLKVIHQEHDNDPEHSGREGASPMNIPIGREPTLKRTWDDSFTPESGAAFSIEEFFDVKRFLSQSVDSEAPEEENDSSELKDILRSTVVLLASVAFALLFTFMIGLQIGFDNDVAQQTWYRAHGYARSCGIVTTYLDVMGVEGVDYQDGDALDPKSLGSLTEYLSLSALSMNSDRHAKFPAPATSMPMRASRPRLDLDRTSQPQLPSQLTPSTETHTGHSQESVRGPKRFSCLQCQRSFSSVSNRNKHMREGCAHREKNGYRCRNAPCTKCLTTKWYRNTHEQERCKYRAAQLGLAGLASSTRSAS